MTECNPLPWRNEPNGSVYGHMRDANGDVVEIYGTHGNELRARITAAVNSRSVLLTAAKEALNAWNDKSGMGTVYNMTRAASSLRAAIEKAEEL